MHTQNLNPTKINRQLSNSYDFIPIPCYNAGRNYSNTKNEMEGDNLKTDFDMELKQLAKKINGIIKTHDYAFEDIFPKTFMLEFTNSTSIDNFLMNSPIEIDFSADMKSLSHSELDQYVSDNTPFATWNAMYIKGVKTFLVRELGL